VAPAAHEAFRVELRESIERLRGLLTLGDPLYIASIVQLRNLFGGWGTYYQPTHEGSEPKVELVCGLLATQPVAEKVDVPTDSDMQQILTELDQVVEVAMLFNLSMPQEGSDFITTLQVTGAMHWMLLRGSSFADHGKDLARVLYGPHDEWMLATYGFTAGDVLEVGVTLEALINERVKDLFDQARRFAGDVVSYVQSSEGSKQLPADILKHLGDDEKVRQLRDRALVDVLQTGIRQVTTFSLDELRARADLSRPDRAEAVLKELSISVGSLKPSEYTGLYDASPLVERPFLEFKGRYLLAIPGMVVRDTLALLEDRFMTRKESFSSARAKTLDALATQYLSDMLPGSLAHTNLQYADAELDGLVLFENLAFVVEGKGTALSVQRHRGDVRRLLRDIGKAVEDAWTQGARAREFILRDGDSVFRDSRGVEIRIPAGSVREVIIVNPTLHELGGHAPQLGRLRALGLFPKGELPWSVYINDLRVIAETCGNPAVFLHYLTWRSRLPLGEGITVSDEIDLWGCYLNNERFGMLADSGKVIVANSSTDFDAYYDGLVGRGPKKARPAKFPREPVTSFVERMASERPSGWREASGVCLDLSVPELAVVSAKATDVARLASRAGRRVQLEVGRVMIVGFPTGSPASSVLDDAEPSNDATLVIYCQEGKANKGEIVWAKYAKDVTFELSDFERAALNAQEASPFRLQGLSGG